mmetsp:Transcript_21440/g.47555  ORF Transcript_21440/g.47555 Transcript_21440/m.47555 type:complete len:342 (-) Transcript_21440:290-1315(-)
MEATDASKTPGYLAIHIEVLILCSLVLFLVRPIHSEGPLLVPEEVANEIHIPSVYENLNPVFQHLRQNCLVVPHPVRLHGQVHHHIAAAPALADPQLLLSRRRVEKVLQEGEVVAEWRHLTLDAHVIWVVAGEFEGDELAVVTGHIGEGAGRDVPGVATFDQRDARFDGRLHHSVLQHVGDHRLGQGATLRLAACMTHFWEPLVLLLRVRKAVADTDAPQWHLEAVRSLLFPDVVRDRWNIVASVGLAKDEEVVALILREGLVKLRQECPHFLCYALLADREREPSGETCRGRLVHPNDVRLVCPAIWVGHCVVPELVHRARAILRKQGELRGAARSTTEP